MENTKKPMPSRILTIVYGLFTLLIMCAIFLLSAQPARDSSVLSEWFLNSPLGQFIVTTFPSLSDKGGEHDIRKYAHMFEYMCLGVSTFLTVGEMLSPYYKKLSYSLFWSWLICLFYACTDEFHQLFVEGRSCQLSDVGVDAVGFTLGIAFIGIILNIFRAKGRRTMTDG